CLSGFLLRTEVCLMVSDGTGCLRLLRKCKGLGFTIED
ncbi:MAG: hypothetical protein ACI81W_003135, partial [Saprospiraceae bacterium]